MNTDDLGLLNIDLNLDNDLFYGIGADLSKYFMEDVIVGGGKTNKEEEDITMKRKRVLLSSLPHANIKSEPGLEPRPISPYGITFVDKVEYHNVSFDDAFVACLRTVFGEHINFLHQQKQQDVSLQDQKCPDISQQVSSSSVIRGEPLKPLGVQIVSNPDIDAITSTSAIATNVLSTSTTTISRTIFRSNQLEQWNQRFHELVEFKEEYDHCLVPLHWPQNPSLAHWVKRQRHQYRMKQEGKHSTLTDERRASLEELGFVWDSHAATWEERLGELRKFRDQHGHCRVPKKYPENQQLAVWVKCQRRQFKLYSEGKDSNMTAPRVQKLYELGFDFSPRAKRTSAVSLAIAQLAAATAAVAAAASS